MPSILFKDSISLCKYFENVILMHSKQEKAEITRSESNGGRNYTVSKRKYSAWRHEQTLQDELHSTSMLKAYGKLF